MDLERKIPRVASALEARVLAWSKWWEAVVQNSELPAQRCTALHSLHDTNTVGGANASTESKALNSW